MRNHNLIYYSFTATLLSCFSTGCTERTSPGESQAPLQGLSRLRSTSLEMASLADADRRSHEAQLMVQALGRADPDQLWTNQKLFLNLENDANAQLWTAWDNFPTLEGGINYLIDQPLLVAALDLQIELRRRLGANNHTVVPGLENDPGCSGDIIEDRLLFRFVAATQIGATAGLGTSAHPTVALLNRFALQVACLSDRQAAELDEALAMGFERVAQRLRFQNLESIVPAFARVVAPLHLLVLDARKVRARPAPS